MQHEHTASLDSFGELRTMFYRDHVRPHKPMAALWERIRKKYSILSHAGDQITDAKLITADPEVKGWIIPAKHRYNEIIDWIAKNDPKKQITICTDETLGGCINDFIMESNRPVFIGFDLDDFIHPKPVDAQRRAALHVASIMAKKTGWNSEQVDYIGRCHTNFRKYGDIKVSGAEIRFFLAVQHVLEDGSLDEDNLDEDLTRQSIFDRFYNPEGNLQEQHQSLVKTILEQKPILKALEEGIQYGNFVTRHPNKLLEYHRDGGIYSEVFRTIEGICTREDCENGRVYLYKQIYDIMKRFAEREHEGIALRIITKKYYATVREYYDQPMIIA